MSMSQDFSRRFFADFIASRIKAWNLAESDARPSTRPPTEVDEDASTRGQPHAGDPALSDEPRGLLGGLGSSGP